MANISAIKLPDNTTYNIRAGAIPYGEVDSTSTSTAFTATVPGINELVDGTIMMLHNGVVTSASGFKININGLGAKKCYNNLTNATQDTTIFNVAYTMVFIYSESLDSGNGGWWLYRGYDANTNTIGYQLRGDNGTRPASDKGYRYRIWLSSLDNQSWVPINTSTATDATTSRSLNSRVIDPFGEIVYYSYNGTTNAAANLTATTIWQQYAFTIGYSYVKSLTAWDPVYLKCEPQTSGGAVMKDIVQALPSTADGFIYIYLGIAYSATAMELRFYHPVYYHDGTGIRAWTGIKVPTKTSELTNDSGYTSFSGSYNDLTDKPTIPVLPSNIVNTVTTTAGTHTTITNATGAVNFKVPTKTSHLTNDSGYITSADLPEGPLIGSTSNITPTQVLTALQAGRDIYLTHAIDVDTSIVATYFDYAPIFGMLVSNITVIFPREYYSYALVGMTSDDTWTTSVTTLAQKIDVPTTALSSTTGITASTTATKTSLGTASSIYGVKSGTNSTTTASKASGSNGSASNWVFEDVACDDITAWSAGSGSASFSATVSNHVLSFSHSHTHTAPTLTYSGKTASHVKSGGNGTAPSWSFTDVTVPIRADSATSVPNVSVASATVTITDPGHTHQLSN